MTQHAEENLRAAETREARRAAERKAEKMAKKEKKRVKIDSGNGDAGDIEGQKEALGGGEAETKVAAVIEERKKVVAVKEEKQKRKAKTPKTPGLIQVLEMQSRVAGYEVRCENSKS